MKTSSREMEPNLGNMNTEGPKKLVHGLSQDQAVESILRQKYADRTSNRKSVVQGNDRARARSG